MKPQIFVFFLTWTVASALGYDKTQHPITHAESGGVVEASTTVPFLLPIPGTLEKAKGNVTVTVSSNGTLGIYALTQLFDRAPSIFSRSWTFRPHNLPSGTTHSHQDQREHPHRCATLGLHIATTAGVTVPIVLPIPDSPSVATGNSTIGVNLDGRLVINTKIAATVEDGGRRSSSSKTSIGIVVAASGGFITVRCGQDEVCMMPEAEIDIQEEEIDVTINGVNGNTAIDIFF